MEMGSYPYISESILVDATYRRSVDFGELALALATAQSEMKNPLKDQTADVVKFKYKYADLASVLDIVRPALSKNGLCLIQVPALLRPLGDNYPTGVMVTSIIVHSSGQWIASDLLLNAKDDTAQGIGGAITYARRYGVQSLCGIAAEEDDDATVASGKVKVLEPQRDELLTLRGYFEMINALNQYNVAITDFCEANNIQFGPNGITAIGSRLTRDQLTSLKQILRDIYRQLRKEQTERHESGDSKTD